MWYISQHSITGQKHSKTHTLRKDAIGSSHHVREDPIKYPLKSEFVQHRPHRP